MRVPTRCPSCRSDLRVRELRCAACATRVEGEYDLCPVCALAEDDRALLDLFLRERGNAKGVERALGVSYPTVRARLEQLWSRLDALRDAAVAAEPPTRPALDVVLDLRERRIDVSQAAALLRNRGRPAPIAPDPGKR